jgi:hypothetical protein
MAGTYTDLAAEGHGPAPIEPMRYIGAGGRTEPTTHGSFSMVIAQFGHF